MKIAIIQPYFCPYIGYFQLINAVDKFVVYDDVNFTKQGWINRNKIWVGNDAAPMVYPFLTKNGKELKSKLIENKIFVATYWSNVFDWVKREDWEYKLTENLVLLPINQRYNTKDMEQIIDVINR